MLCQSLAAEHLSSDQKGRQHLHSGLARALARKTRMLSDRAVPTILGKSSSVLPERSLWQ